MNFKEQEEKLIQFITDNYRNYYSLEPEIVMDFLDFDKYKKDFTLFIDFSRIDFRQSNYDDDCGDIEHLLVTIYLVRRNDTPAKIQADLLDASWALYKMIRDKLSLGIAQNTSINSIDFYRYVEGTKYLVCSEFTLSLDIEI
jgi:hypothetical protein